MDEDRIPVIIGIGEIADRPEDPGQGLEPLGLMAAALERADADAGGGLVREIDGLTVVNVTSWRYADVPAQLAAWIGIAPAHRVYGPIGGESPVRLLQDAALRIARGDSKVAAVVGGEAQSTLVRARAAGVSLPWTPALPETASPLRADFLNPLADRLDVTQPTNVYPFYDQATATHWGQTPREALAESGLLWSRYAKVAAANPYTWGKRAYTPEEITTPTPDNRLIAWPYTKLMVANPTVNHGSAILVTSLARAKAAGIAPERLIHFWGGAAANEPRDYIHRDQYYQSYAQDAALEAAMEIVGGRGFDALELYSCFPCVPKMARRTLGLGPDVEPSVAGGLTFFGAALNNYMSHGICGMVRRLREGAEFGLVYGQGEFVTKHHALVLSTTPAPKPLEPVDAAVQQRADSRRGPVPAFEPSATGPAVLETSTVLYDRSGAPRQGVVILRCSGGARTMARVPAADTATIALLTSLERSPIGSEGTLTRATDGLSDWRAA